MPFSYGGNITNLDEIKKLIELGVEKVVLNSIVHQDQDLISEAADYIGSSSVVVSVDYKKSFFGNNRVYISKKNQLTKHKVLEFCLKVTDVGITKIGEGCPQLKSLYLDSCWKVTDVGITKIAEGCSKLHSLDLEFCSKVTEDGLSKIVEGCTQLKYLNLRHCEQVTKVWIMKFKKKYHNILFNY